MLKSKWIASVLALALIVTPVQGVTAAEAVTGTETVTDTEAATTSGGNAVTAVVQSADETSDAADAVEEKLDAPTGLTWEVLNGFSIYPKWNAVESKTDSGVSYSMDISYNGGEYRHFQTTTNTQFWLSVAELNENGVYTFRVRAEYQNHTAYPDETYASAYAFSEPLTIEKLATPTAKWGEGWMPVLDDSQNKGQIRYFDVDIYKNGERIEQTADLWVRNEENDFDHSQINRVDFLSKFNDSGAYQITMKAVPTEKSTYFESDISARSEVKNYVMPDKHLDVPTVKPHATLPGVFEIGNLDGSIGCVLELYYDRGTNGAEWVKVGTSTHSWGNLDIKGRTTYYDFRRDIDGNSNSYGLGQYKVQARAISGNIDEVANSYLSYLPDCEPSVISSLPLDMTPVRGNNNVTPEDPVITPSTTVSDEKAAEIKNSLENIVNDNSTAAAKVDTIKDKENKEELGAAMQQDSSVAQLMSSIENAYLKEKDITVSKNIATKVNTFMDPNAISVVGAGLNVESGKVALDVSVPDKRVDLGRKYNNYNNLQFEIKLVGDNLAEHGKLAVPVLITMPIPKGLNANNLEIIHCKTDGTYERIAPKNNGNGTISFAVTEFSTFAFVSPAETSSNDSDNSGSAEIVYNVDWNNVQNTVAANKTGTTDITTGNSMQVSGQLLQTLKDTKGVLALHTGNGIAVSICGKDVKKTDKNVALTFAENPNIPASAKSSVLTNALYSRSFEMKEKVLYSVKMDIHFNVGKQFAGKYANLYHYDELTGTMKLEGSYRITNTGAAMFLLYHGDEYILTVTEKAPKGVVAGGVSNADYTVAKGDTLWGIAAKNGISLRKILAANPNLKNPDKIRVGQKIVIK